MADPVAPTRMGIDFGTSNTVVVWTAPGRGVMPLLFDGSPVLPSAVFAADDRLLTGRDAERAAMSKPAAFEPHPKRCLSHGTVLLGKTEYPAETLVAAVLSRVANEAYRVMGHIPGSLVMTHPAAWAGERLRLLAQAARYAGFPEPVLTPEPVAAATHFSAHRGHQVPEGGHMVVYDLGGGTFDVSVVRCQGGSIDVVATGGLPDVGGIDIDFAIIEHLERTYAQHAEGWQRLRLPRSPKDRRHRRGLWRDVRDAKELLSRESAASLFIPILDVDAHLTRQELEDLANPLLDQTVEVTMEVLARAGVALQSVAGLFLVGGASRMPLSSTLLMRQTQIAPTVLEQPELVVANGALAAPVQPVPAPGAASAQSAVPHVFRPTPVIPRQVYRGVARVPQPMTTPMPVVPTATHPPAATWPAPAPPVGGETVQPWPAPVPPAQEMVPQPMPVADEAPADTWQNAGEAGPAADTAPEPPAESARREAEDGGRDETVTGDAAENPVGGAQDESTGEPFGQTMSVTVAPTVEGGVSSLAVRRDRHVAMVRGRSVLVVELESRDVSAVLDDHVAAPTAVRWSPDGDRLAAACGTEVKLWPVDAEGGVDEAELRSYACPERVLELAWSGDHLASGDVADIVVWNAETGEQVRSRRFGDGPSPSQLRALEWSKDGTRLAAGGSLGDVTIWALDDETEPVRLSVAPVAVRSLAWSPDGEWVVIGDAGGGLTVWQLPDSVAVQSIGQAHNAAVQCVAWSADGKLLASGSIDGLIRVWDAGSGRERAVLEGHAGVVNALTWLADGDRLVSGGTDGTVRVWHAEEGRQLS